MSFTCPKCFRTSHHPEDERHRYCGRCHESFSQHISESTDVVTITHLITEARVIMGQGVVDGLAEQHQQHWRAVIAWLQVHLPPEHVSDTAPCHDCLDLGVRTEDGVTWTPCTCPVGQYLDDLSG